MKTGFSITIATLLLVTAGALAQEPSAQPYVTVFGYAEDWVDADTVVWTVRLEHTGKDLADIKQDNDRELERVIAVAKQLGVPHDLVTVGRVLITKEYKPHKNGYRALRFYRLTRVIKIRQDDVDLYEVFLHRLAIDGDLNAVANFQVTDAEERRQHLQTLAAQNARQKAEALTVELDTALGAPLIISEYPILTDYQQIDHLSKQAGVVMRTGPSKVRLRNKIYVRFELLNPAGETTE